MTDEKFTDLVNLYLDKEISEEELKLLKSEIGNNSDRKQIFVERCRLHKAMRLALKSERSRSRSRRSGSRSRSRRSSRRSGSRATASTKITEADEFASGTALFPRWMLASGMAACLVIGFVLLPQVFRDTVDPFSQPELVGVTKSELADEDPLDSLSGLQLRRFANVQQQREADYHASLISQMRLMGLRPELTPKNKQLQTIDVTAVYKPTRRVNQAELFQRIQGLKAMPEHKLLQFEGSSEMVMPLLESTEPALVKFEEL